MDIKKLYSFAAVMKYHNLADAAAATFISESALSKQIDSLEKEFGTVFFVRRAHGLLPTESARIFDEYAEQALLDYQNVSERIHIYNQKNSNLLKVASAQITSEYRLLDCSFLFMKDHPDIQCSFEETESGDICKALIEGKVSTAIVMGNMIDSSQFETIDISHDELVAVMPVSHRFANAPSVSITRLKDEGFVIPGINSAHYFLTAKACRKHGFEPHVRFSTSRLHSLIYFVEHGLGISLLLNQVAQDYSTDKIRIVPLSEHISCSIVMARLKYHEPTKAAKLFWDYTSNYFHTANNQ